MSLLLFALLDDGHFVHAYAFAYLRRFEFSHTDFDDAIRLRLPRLLPPFMPPDAAVLRLLSMPRLCATPIFSFSLIITYFGVFPGYLLRRR